MSESDERIVSDVEDFARRNPWAVAAGGLALGFVASRLLKASSSRRYRERMSAGTPAQAMTPVPLTTLAPGDPPRRQRAAAARSRHRAAHRRAVLAAGHGGRSGHPRAVRPARSTVASEQGSGATARSLGDGDASLRDRPIGELFSRLSADTSTLIRQEMALARAEPQEKGRESGKGAGLFGVAGAVGLPGAGAITAGIILALDLGIAARLAAIVVGPVYVAVAAFLGLRGREQIKRATPPVPEQTVETVKEEVIGRRNRAT